MNDLPRPAALEQLLADSAWAWQLAAQLTRDSHAAEDSVQELWLRALRRTPELGDAPQAGRPWVRVVLRRLAQSAERRKTARLERERAAARAEALPPADRALEREALRRSVVEAVLALPDAYRDVVLLHHFDGLALAEIARRTDAPTSTVRSRLARAHGQLRQRLARGHAAHDDARLAALAAAIPRAAGLLGVLSIMKLKFVAALAAVVFLALWMQRAVAPEATPTPSLPVEAAARVAEPRNSVARDAAEPDSEREAVHSAFERAEGATASVRVVRSGDFAPQEGATVRWILEAELSGATQFIPIGDDERERRIQAAPDTTRSNAAGLAQLPPASARRYVTAQWNELWGAAWLAPDQDAALEIVLSRDALLRVSALDAAGNPVVGLELAVTRAGRASPELSATTRAPDGVAVVPHALATLFGGEPRGVLLVRSRSGAAGAPQVLAPASPWPTLPMELRTAPSGVVEVRLVDALGQQLAGVASVSLTANEVEQFWVMRRASARAGSAVFEHVPLGLTLNVSAFPSPLVGRWGSRGVVAAGPTQPGERVVVDYPLVNGHASFRGRALGPDGAPLTNAKLYVTVRSAEEQAAESWQDSGTTDAEGRFELAAGRRETGEGRAALVVVRATEAQLEATLQLPPAPPEGALELGDVRLRRPALLAAGRVVSTKGTPVAGARVRLNVRNGPANEASNPPPGYAIPDWIEDHARTCWTDRDGSFELFVDDAPRGIGVDAEATGYAKSVVQPLAQDARDIELVLEPLTSLRGRIVGASGVVLERLRVHCGANSAAVDEHGRFAVRARESQATSLCVVGPGAQTPLVCLEGLRGPQDPRLARIELAEPPHVLEVRVVGPEHLPTPAAKLQWSCATPPSSGAVDAVGAALIVAPAEQVDVLVSAAGMRAARFSAVRDGDTLTLREQARLLLVVPDALPVATRDQPYVVQVRQPGSSELLHQRIEAGRESSLHVPRGGAWTVHWMVPTSREVLQRTTVEIDEHSDEALRVVLELDATTLERARTARRSK